MIKAAIVRMIKKDVAKKHDANVGVDDLGLGCGCGYGYGYGYGCGC